MKQRGRDERRKCSWTNREFARGNAIVGAGLTLVALALARRMTFDVDHAMSG